MRILLLNPNSSVGMTSNMVQVANNTIPTATIDIVPFTAPIPSPGSINDGDDIAGSTVVVMDHIAATQINLKQYDAILIACFSVHELVSKLATLTGKPVIGLFEASILTSLSLISASEKWGIITTGEFWIQHLQDGVNEFLGVARGRENYKFAGVYSTGLTAAEFHSASENLIKSKLAMAVGKLFESGNVTCLVLGCGGMAGLEETIRLVAADVVGERAKSLYIIDGVRAGVAQLYYAVTSRDVFTGHGQGPRSNSIS